VSDLLTARARIAGATSQQAFEVFLRTLAEPGTIRALPSELAADIPPPLWLALALADVDTPVHVHDDPTGQWGDVVAAATGAPLVELDQARIVAAAGPITPPLDRIAVGAPLAPESAAMVALPVRSLDTDGAATWQLSGPGVPGRRALIVAGAPADLDHRAGRASGPFPTGFDLWLVAADRRVAAIPRSTTVERPGGH
jgi:alpha-D-ribose 1-methylphosphonate 5-triphosphate synthase subunit PhnH